jgi:hypothetical protein
MVFCLRCWFKPVFLTRYRSPTVAILPSFPRLYNRDRVDIPGEEISVEKEVTNRDFEPKEVRGVWVPIAFTYVKTNERIDP